MDRGSTWGIQTMVFTPQVSSAYHHTMEAQVMFDEVFFIYR
jgi:hypothetical protein